MKTNTALRAEKDYSRTITFKNEAHKKFYMEYLPKCRYQDVYHKSLVYSLGINSDTRNHVNNIYDFETGCVKPECLHESWQTSGSMKVVRMAYNLYCNGKRIINALLSIFCFLLQWFKLVFGIMRITFGRRLQKQLI